MLFRWLRDWFLRYFIRTRYIDSLTSIPIQPIGLVKQFLASDVAAESSLIASCKDYRAVFQPKRMSQLLLLAIVHADQAKAEIVIKLNPELLLAKATVTDFSGRQVTGTALQIALAAMDVKYHTDECCMVEMLNKHFKRLGQDWQLHWQQQVAERFPPGWQVQQRTRVAADSAALHEVTNAIVNLATIDDDSCQVAIAEFKAYLAAQIVPTQGMYFNHDLLLEAIELYNANYQRCGGWASNRNILFWRQVIGAIQRYLPTVTAQVHCQNPLMITNAHYHRLKHALYQPVVGSQPLKRSLSLTFFGGATKSFFPLDQHHLQLGEHVAVGAAERISTSAVTSSSIAHIRPPEYISAHLSAYLNRKHQICMHYIVNAQAIEESHSPTSVAELVTPH